jgi:hypothetical protein
MARDAGLLSSRRISLFRIAAVAFWLACVAYVAVPSASPGKPAGEVTRFKQPSQPVHRILRLQL